MINSFVYPNYMSLSDGHYMVHKVTDEMISVMWSKMSRPQREEFEILYGEEEAFDGFKTEIKDANHSAAFFCGMELTCLIWADWGEIGGMGRVRTMGCVCSDFALKHTINFVRHSKEVRDAFMLLEPSNVHEIYVFITETFKQSRNWAVRVCGFKEHCRAKAKGEEFVCYKHVLGEE